jgi:thiamine pyrophosphate-dependent acetolactate synthase large subunit-like protein
MAAGYASAMGSVGFASVTCGPGFTQLMTALSSIERDKLPVVVLAGEVSLGIRYNLQEIDQKPFATACGAHYISAHSPTLIQYHFQEAFRIAQTERRPVVLGVPQDLQKQDLPNLPTYEPSATFISALSPMFPDPAEIDCLTEKLLSAKYPVIIAGQGVLAADADDGVERVADLTGAILGTTLPARGLYDSNQFSVGVIGGYGRTVARECIQNADLIVAFGASLTTYTRSGGKALDHAEIIQVDVEPVGRFQGLKVAQRYVRSDAKIAAAEILKRLGNGSRSASRARTPQLAKRIKEEPADDGAFSAQAETVDPRAVFDRLEQLLPKDYDVISGSGHQAYFHTVMRGYDPRRYHHLRNFGAIGNALAYAVGVAEARKNNGKVVLFEGDGGLLMHIQEFEAIQRHGFKLLMVICNDGAYGAEVQSLHQEGLSADVVKFGRPDLASIAAGFGLRGERVTKVEQLEDCIARYESGSAAMLLDVHINELVVSPSYRLRLNR